MKVLTPFALLGMGVALVLTGCFGDLVAGGAPAPPDTPPRYVKADAATLTFRLETIGCCYIEGAIQAVEVDGPVDAAWKLEDSAQVRLPPGDYTVTVYEQVCGGSCDFLTQPQNHCTMAMVLEPGARLEVDVTYPLDEPCVIAVAS